MSPRSRSILFSAWAAAPLLAQVEIGAVQVDTSPLGRDYVTADVYINVPEPSDWWTVGGISGGPVADGLEHHLIYDPNGHDTGVTAPGNSTPELEFSTFVSLPRGQFANNRFRWNGAAAIVGGYLPPSPYETYQSLRINIAFMEFPVSPDGSGVPDFGFIARVTLRNNPNFSGVPTDQIVVSGVPGPGRLLAEYQVASASRLHPVPLSEFAFGFYAIPEPSAGVLFGLGTLLYLRRRG